MNITAKQSLYQVLVPAGVVLATSALIFAGCGKAKEPATEAPASLSANSKSNETNPAPVSRPTLTPTRQQTTAPNGQPDLNALNRGLIRWIVKNQRPPANFNDFAATAGIAIPPPPPGEKYIIAKNMHIQLVNK